MTVQVGNHNFSAIGRMFARQSVSAVYGRQKAAGEAEAGGGAFATDRVDLSPFAPRPLSENLFSDALAVARDISDGGGLSTDEAERLREDRIFGAVCALAVVSAGGGDVETLPQSWPAGLPAPTRAEMEEARRRLTQRLKQDEVRSDAADALQRERAELLEKVRNRDLSPAAAMWSGQTGV